MEKWCEGILLVNSYQLDKIRRDRLYHKMQNLFAQILFYQREHGFSPSYRDLRDMAGISSTSMVKYYLSKMRKQGLIRYADDMARTIRTTDEGKEVFRVK